MTKKKPLSSIGLAHAQSVWTLDNFGEMAMGLAAKGQIPSWFAQGLAAATKENHATAADVCTSQGFELPARPVAQGGGGPGTK